MLKSSFTSDKLEAGCDEAGRGCLAGPVVAAAVILPKDYQHDLLNDSKQLTPEARTAIRKDIVRDALAWAVAEVGPAEIDMVNILNASIRAMHLAVDKLQILPELLLIDGNRFKPYPSIAHECFVQGDARFMSIAAASILAKTYRDAFMQKLAVDFPGYGWEKNAGYPTRQHRQAIRESGVTPHHRKSFRLLPEQINLFD